MHNRTEKQIEHDIVRSMRAMGYHVSKFSQPRASKQTEGIPDLYAMGHGCGLWIEVKTATGRVRPSQLAWHAEAERNGVAVVVARSTADVVAALRGLGAPIQS